MRMRGLILASLAAGCIFLAACPGGGSSSRAAGTDSVPSDDIIRIYFIPKDIVNPYFAALNVGFNNAIAQLGEDNFRFTYTGPDTAEDPVGQIPYIEEAIQNGADAIFIAANSSNALNDTFDKARAAGIRVYIINQDIPGSEEHRDAAIMPVNFDTIGAAQVELLGSQIGYQGEIAILSATREAPDQNTWVALMREELKRPKYAKMRLVEIAYGDDEDQKSAAVMEELLVRHPNLKGVIVPTAAGLPAACRVARERGLSSKIKITGLGLPSQMEEFVMDGTCEGFHLWNPPFEGYMGVFLVWNEKREGFSPAPGAVFSAGKLGEHTILANGQILTLEAPMLYDKSNIKEYAILF
jgi:rhamnose transport system substrate-binding protein